MFGVGLQYVGFMSDAFFCCFYTGQSVSLGDHALNIVGGIVVPYGLARDLLLLISFALCTFDLWVVTYDENGWTFVLGFAGLVFRFALFLNWVVLLFTVIFGFLWLLFNVCEL